MKLKGPLGIAVLILAPVLAAGPVAATAGGADEAFGAAIERRDFAGAVELLGAGADPNIRLGYGKTALMARRKRGRSSLRAVSSNVGRSGARNATAGPPLMFAAIPGHVATMALLIEHGADVHALAHFNWTALMVAASKGHGEGVRLLLRHGADPNVQDTYGWTPLMRAVHGDKRDAVTALLEHDRVDLEARDERGATALHVAVERGRSTLVAELLAHGADPGSTDDAGRGLLHKASAQGYDDIASMLESRKVQ